MSLLGKRLKQARKNTGHTQEYVANILGTTYQTISNYERGVRDPDTDSLDRLASLLNVTTDYLLGRTDDPAPPAAPPRPDYKAKILAFKTLGDASLLIAELHSEDKIDDVEFIHLSKIAYKHFGLPPVKDSDEAAHQEHNIPGTGVLDRRTDGKNRS